MAWDSDAIQMNLGKPKLSPLERITLTAEGRRHLADEMAKRSKAQKAFSTDRASGFILKQLLSEFRDRNLNITDLDNGYMGLTVPKLKESAGASGIPEVDFDLALQDLESSELIKSGPLEVAGGTSNQGVVFVPLIYSKREYLSLKSDGYKEAAKLRGDVDQRPKTEFAESRGTTVFNGDQYIVYTGHVAAIGPHSNGTINCQQQC